MGKIWIGTEHCAIDAGKSGLVWGRCMIFVYGICSKLIIFIEIVDMMHICERGHTFSNEVGVTL